MWEEVGKKPELCGDEKAREKYTALKARTGYPKLGEKLEWVIADEEAKAQAGEKRGWLEE